MLWVPGVRSDDEARLIEHLFESRGYNPLIRPVRNMTELVIVKFGMAMIQLINIVRMSQLDFLVARR